MEKTDNQNAPQEESTSKEQPEDKALTFCDKCGEMIIKSVEHTCFYVPQAKWEEIVAKSKVEQHTEGVKPHRDSIIGAYLSEIEALQERNAKLEEEKKELLNILVGNNLEFQKKELECYQLQAQVDSLQKENSDLKHWKQSSMDIWNPILDYCQDSQNAERLGIKLGGSISKRILEILNTYP